jgi:hypothetical protein
MQCFSKPGSLLPASESLGQALVKMQIPASNQGYHELESLWEMLRNLHFKASLDNFVSDLQSCLRAIELMQ